jgi:hypothetical protein
MALSCGKQVTVFTAAGLEFSAMIIDIYRLPNIK